MIDPVCGMQVEPNTAAEKHEYKGQTYFFCSHHCLAQFKEDPEKFLKPQPHEHHDHVQAAPHMHGHPGHAHEHADAHAPQLDKTVEARNLRLSHGPRGARGQARACPKCGMALEPAAPSAPA